MRQARASGVPIYVLRSNTVAQMQQSLAAALQDDSEQPRSPRRQALKETYEAIKRTLSTAEAIELAPQKRLDPPPPARAGGAGQADLPQSRSGAEPPRAYLVATQRPACLTVGSPLPGRESGPPPPAADTR